MIRAILFAADLTGVGLAGLVVRITAGSPLALDTTIYCAISIGLAMGAVWRLSDGEKEHG